ncbi:MAG: type II secretion system F family protein [Patescibacteria group bacterium]
MATFKVRIINATGEHLEETVQASDQAALYAIIREKGETLVAAEEVNDSQKKAGFSIPFISRKVKTRDKITFARNLGSMIEAGLSMARALNVIEKQTRQKKFKDIIASITKSISQGRTLSESMKDYPGVFNNLMTSMVRAGEESGSLAQALRMISNQMESSYKLTQKIRGALMYPAVILVAVGGIGVFMLTYVVPTLSATFKEMNAELPASTKMVIAASDFLKDHYFIVAGLFIIVASAVYMMLKSVKGKRFLDWAFLRIPVIGVIVKQVNAARTARTLSSLLTAGVDVVVATRITADVLQNSYYKEVLGIVEEKIQKGETIAHVFNGREDLYPSFVGEMISVGEETGQLAPMLLGVANFYESEVDQKTKDMSSIIEPFLMVFIGLVVGFFAITMMSPIYSLGNNL